MGGDFPIYSSDMATTSRNTGAPASYVLTLSGEQSWRLTAFGDACPWLERLASIMHLGSVTAGVDGYRNLLIARDRTSLTPEAVGDALGFEGTEIVGAALDGSFREPMQAVRFYRSNIDDTIIGEIGPEAPPVGEYLKMQHLFAPVFRSLIDNGGFPFHAALVARREGAVVLAGSGGAGKSTCARRVPAPWKVLCDDLTVIVRFEPNSYMAHPFPTWSDYFWERGAGTWDTNTAVPLRAVFFIEQAEKEAVVPMGQGEAAMVINTLAAQMYQPHWQAMEVEDRRLLRLRLFENVGDAAQAIPAYLLRVALRGSFWKRIEEVFEW
jgi:SynChlorMet cassette protein ScmC